MVGKRGWVRKLRAWEKNLDECGAWLLFYSFDDDGTANYNAGSMPFSARPWVDTDPEMTLSNAPDGALERLQQIMSGHQVDYWTELRD